MIIAVVQKLGLCYRVLNLCIFLHPCCLLALSDKEKLGRLFIVEELLLVSYIHLLSEREALLAALFIVVFLHISLSFCSPASMYPSASLDSNAGTDQLFIALEREDMFLLKTMPLQTFYSSA